MDAQLQRNDWDSVAGYSHSVQTMMLMAMKQASGRPWGDHGLFLRYHIEAATIKGINSFRQYKTDTTTIGRSESAYTDFHLCFHIFVCLFLVAVTAINWNFSTDFVVRFVFMLIL